MAERVVHVSDISLEMIESPDQLVELVVDHPSLDERVRLEAMPEDIAKLGDLAIKGPVIVDVKRPDAEEERFVLTTSNFDKLAPSKERSMSDVLAGAMPVIKSKVRRSHNTTVNGEPLRDYNNIEWAGTPHKGKISQEEATLVRDNLEQVNERLASQGLRPIDPQNPDHARRYGFENETSGSES